jgi:hypothetical protein
MRLPNSGTRTLSESVMSPEVNLAIRDWVRSANPSGVLIGGLALSFYARPRYTQDVDILYLTVEEVPETVEGFRRHRQHAFEHRQTGVEIEIVTPEHVGVPVETIQTIISTAVERDGVRIASPVGLVVSKLFRFNMRDRADIIDLMKSSDIDVGAFHLPPPQLERYIVALADAENE